MILSAYSVCRPDSFPTGRDKLGLSMPDATKVLADSRNHARKENAGEDADPILWLSSDFSCGVLATFDGMGGAGSAVRTLPTGEIYTDAYIASRIVRETTLEFAQEHSANSMNFDTTSLENTIKAALENIKEDLHIVPSRLRSTMSKILPTTMAMMSWATSKGGIDIYSYWAGDSRNYILRAEGLLQASQDHVRGGGDALCNLHNDPPLSNAISQSDSFYISKLQFLSDAPVILISCTDGCFGYVMTPMHFEKLLLDTLYMSDNIHDWVNHIDDMLLDISGDDYSFAITMIGLSFEDWKKALLKRHQRLMKAFIRPYELYQSQLNELPKAMDTIWNAYKDGAEQLLGSES